MELSAYLKHEDWQENGKFEIRLSYRDEDQNASVTEYLQGEESLFLAQLENGKMLLVAPHSVHPHGYVNWFPIDVDHFDLAHAVGEAIERAENTPLRV